MLKNTYFSDHWCTPPAEFAPENLSLSLDEWKMKFLPQELGPDYQMRPSQCNMFAVNQDNLPKFLSGELPGNTSENIEKIACRDLAGWTYDQT